ncbi:MAG: methanogenesis marker protein Mmp4/MtxX [Candidatus Helarchaeota archaeon]
MIVKKIINLAKETKSRIAIGLGDSPEYIQRTIKVAEKALDDRIAELVLVGKKEPNKTQIEFIQSGTPEKTLMELIDQNKVEGIVRGSLSSSKFLIALKKIFQVDVLHRLALLETAESYQFFFAPVGIDECKNVEEKLFFVEKGVQFMKKLKIKPIIAILSGGREEDKLREANIAKNIDEANEVVKKAMARGIKNIKNYNILIEDAIQGKSNIIIGPEGISGNLIYRTLVHLGNGKSHGAIYLGLNKPIIDTSRVGPEFEYYSAIAFASALKNLKN